MTLRIVVVEDDESIRTMLEYYFKSMGHEVLAFESGEDFFAAAPVADLALLDGMLPGMDGLDIVRRLRSEEATAKMPIIMLTARQTEMDKVTALDLGADDYISKPFGVISLTYKEFELLCLLVRRRGTVLTRDEILAAVWDYDFTGETRTVDMHIKALRQKLGEGYITTVRSVGYKMG